METGSWLEQWGGRGDSHPGEEPAAGAGFGRVRMESSVCV